MASFERFDVVRVPFPFTDRQAEKNRPVLVISDGAAFNRVAGHSVMAMITSASHAPWPLDVPIGDIHFVEAGRGIQIFGPPRRQVIHYRNLMPVQQE